MKLEEIDKLLGEITQGDWWVDPDGPEYSVNYKGPLDTFRHVAMVSCYIHRHGDKEENEANARLIAAAPTIIKELVEDNKRLRGSLRRIVEAPLYECTGNDQFGCIELMSNIAVADLKEST